MSLTTKSKKIIGFILIISGVILAMLGFNVEYDPSLHYASDKFIEAFSFLIPAAILGGLGFVFYSTDKG